VIWELLLTEETTATGLTIALASRETIAAAGPVPEREPGHGEHEDKDEDLEAAAALMRCPL
jgi:hypothetical protein